MKTRQDILDWVIIISVIAFNVSLTIAAYIIHPVFGCVTSALISLIIFKTALELKKEQQP